MWGPEALLNEWLKMNVQRLRRRRSSKKVRKSELFWKTFFFFTFYMFRSLNLYANQRKCMDMWLYGAQTAQTAQMLQIFKRGMQPLFFGGRGESLVLMGFFKGPSNFEPFSSKLKKHVQLLLHASCWGLTRPQDSIVGPEVHTPGVLGKCRKCKADPFNANLKKLPDALGLGPWSDRCRGCLPETSAWLGEGRSCWQCELRKRDKEIAEKSSQLFLR